MTQRSIWMRSAAYLYFPAERLASRMSLSQLAGATPHSATPLARINVAISEKPGGEDRWPMTANLPLELRAGTAAVKAIAGQHAGRPPRLLTVVALPAGPMFAAPPP